MSDVIPSQHPAVVLRSHYMHLRALLAVMLIAVVGLTAAVIVLVIDNGTTNTAPRSSAALVASPAVSASSTPGQTTRYDGGPEEGTRGIRVTGSSQHANPYAYNGGHEEGLAGE